jgi:hypothetical protein
MQVFLEIPGLARYFMAEDHPEKDMYNLIRPIFDDAY